MAKRHHNRIGSLESMFLRLEELLLANSGEDEFDEIFKLLIAKLWDERSGKLRRFKAYAKEIDTYQAVLSLMREAEKVWPGILEPASEPALMPEHLQICVEAFAQHTISDSTLEVMDGFFEFLVSRGAKGAKGQYFTPRYVIEMCVRMLEPHSDELVLDPACGSGGFLIHALNYLRENKALRDLDIAEYCTRHLWGFDMDSKAVQVAKALMVLIGDGQANILRLNSLLKPEALGLFEQAKMPNDNDSDKAGPGLTIEDICRSRMRRHQGFDVILTNPPFAGEVREKQVLNSYTLADGRLRIERDILFLERCVELLRPGGRMAIVLPHNKFAASSFTYVRQWLIRKCRILAVVGLGRHTFLPHTHQKASVLFARKRQKGERVAPDEATFFAVSENDGKDSKGRIKVRTEQSEDTTPWLRVDHDLGEVVTAFKDFCGQHSVIQEA
jgi:type I restriction enzyme M protein